MSVFLTGFADEAAGDIQGQIAAIRSLGWRHLEARNVDGRNLHDLDAAAFDDVARALDDAGVRVNALGSNIANWAKSVEDPVDSSLEETRRAIPRMHRLGVRQVRIMSFAVLADRAADDQLVDERVARLNTICALFRSEGLEPLHENCMNYGGLSWEHTLRLVERVPGLRLVFDTANPGLDLPHSPRQSSWEFFEHIQAHVAHIHIKDMVWDAEKNAPRYVCPGEGDREVPRILAALRTVGYTGGISIEPHMQVVFHDTAISARAEARRANFQEYGRRMERLVRAAGLEIRP
ncbi:MAG: sugar phosphate isomerase/epimerase [Candidatus Marinimicrobia bacterium]|nr:sugar phosphate isomerase/epimerase [Candidatus Neomarinimicrobiota bacterium]